MSTFMESDLPPVMGAPMYKMSGWKESYFEEEKLGKITVCQL